MSDIKRFAIFAIITNSDEEKIRSEQRHFTNLTGNTMALGFPVHITLKGRFLASKDIVVNLLNKTDLASLCSQTEIELSKPKYIYPQLSWLEVLSDTPGFNNLLFLHSFFEREINRFVVSDEVPENHKNAHFRPHITLGWGITPRVWQKYSSIENFGSVQIGFSHIALACYHQQWPLEETVTSIMEIPIMK